MSYERWNRRQRARSADSIKVVIEEVNLDAKPFPLAQGRDRTQWGLIDIDLSHSTGSDFPLPRVGEVWWVRRSTGSRWILDAKVDQERRNPELPPFGPLDYFTSSFAEAREERGVTVFSAGSGGVWINPGGVGMIMVMAVGGGKAGNTGTSTVGGGGGTGGSWGWGWFSLNDLPGSVEVRAGRGGVAAAENGESSYFGDYLVVPGGGGGTMIGYGFPGGDGGGGGDSVGGSGGNTGFAFGTKGGGGGGGGGGVNAGGVGGTAWGIAGGSQTQSGLRAFMSFGPGSGGGGGNSTAPGGAGGLYGGGGGGGGGGDTLVRPGGPGGDGVVAIFHF